MQNFMIFCRWTRDFFRLGVQAVFIRNPEQVSLLYFLHELRMCGGFLSLVSIENGLQVDGHLTLHTGITFSTNS